MAFIAPNSTIQLFKNMPLFPDYENSIYFVTENLQNNYYSHNVFLTLDNNSYQRARKGRLKIGMPYGTIYQCNYMRFKNTSYENKWFYAFILRVTYISNETCEIVYALDELQTWITNFTLQQCFIERQHSAHDYYYENLIPENLELGDDYIEEFQEEYDLNAPATVDYPNALFAAFMASETPRGNTINPGTVLNVLCGTYLYGNYPNKTAQMLAHYNDLTPPYTLSTPQAVIAVYMYPSKMGAFTDLSDDQDDPDVHPITNPWTDLWQLSSANILSAMTSFKNNDYVPRNKKLYTYPYKFVRLYNGNGKHAVFKWEGWSPDTYHEGTQSLVNALGKFALAGTPVPPVSVTCYPRDYNGFALDRASGLVTDNFPQGTWGGDAFKAWFAQNKASIAMTLVGTAVTGSLTHGLTMGSAAPIYPGSALAGAVKEPNYERIDILENYEQQRQMYNDERLDNAATKDLMGQFSNTYKAVSSVVGKSLDLLIAPPQITGQIGTDTLSAAQNLYKYYAQAMCIKPSIAAKIDKYFDLYGYAQHTVAVPSLMNNRKRWCFTKTAGCQIKGNLPSDSATAIEKIFDKGIRFWRSGDDIGDYSLDNSPQTNNQGGD